MIVQICLVVQHFGNASEKVINALLEGSLPPELAALDSQAATLPQGYGARPGVSPPSGMLPEDSLSTSVPHEVAAYPSRRTRS